MSTETTIWIEQTAVGKCVEYGYFIVDIFQVHGSVHRYDNFE